MRPAVGCAGRAADDEADQARCILRREHRTGGSPVRQQPGRPVDDEVRQPVGAEDLIHHVAAAARVEDVLFEEEERDSRPPHRPEQIVKSRRIPREPTGIALRAAVGRRCGADDRVNSVAAARGNQRDESAKGLPG